MPHAALSVLGFFTGLRGGGDAMEEHCADHSAHERAIRSHDKRLDTHGSQLDALTENLVALREIEQQNQARLDRMESRVDEIEAKPGRRWDALVEKALLAVCAAVVGWAIGFVGF